MMHWSIVAAVAIIFAFAAFLGAQLAAAVCANIEPFEDGPRTGKPPTLLLCVGAAGLGAVIASRGTIPPGIAILALLVCGLAACWCSDVRTGIIPDYFTLVPLAGLLVVSVFERNWLPVVSLILVGLPFAGAALVSKGRGMGWGDVKLVMLAAAVLLLPMSFFAISGACMLAVFVASFRKRRGEPIAFAPYLVTAVAVALCVPSLP